MQFTNRSHIFSRMLRPVFYQCIGKHASDNVDPADPRFQAKDILSLSHHDFGGQPVPDPSGQPGMLERWGKFGVSFNDKKTAGFHV